MSFNPAEHLIDIRGKKYLEVKWRLVWFHEEKPDWSLETVYADFENAVIFKCAAKNPEGRIMATGHGRLVSTDWPRYFEKAETASIGRCLAILGFGTQFAEEFDEDVEGGELADAPVAPKSKPSMSDMAVKKTAVDPRKEKIKTLCDDFNPLLVKKEDYEEFVLNKTGFVLKDENYDMIIKSLGMLTRGVQDIAPVDNPN